MNNNLGVSVSFTLPNGREITLETGKYAKQADGSVMLKSRDVVILATATSSREANEAQSFFPLSVDYQEKIFCCRKNTRKFL
ncbi:MAG: hypothetical protein R2771_04475 [Saprospiraceae bacterium]